MDVTISNCNCGNAPELETREGEGKDQHRLVCRPCVETTPWLTTLKAVTDRWNSAANGGPGFRLLWGHIKPTIIQ